MPKSFPSLPLFVRLAGQPVLVLGGGRLAARRVAQLLAAGARITVVAPAARASIASAHAAGRLTWHRRAPAPADAAGQRLVFALDDEPEVNDAIAAAASVAGAAVQRADAPEASDFFSPAVLRRGALRIAIGSDATAPTLVRLLRATLDAWIPRAYGDLATLAGRYRKRVRNRLPPAARASFWTGVFDGPIAEKVFAGRTREARRDLERLLDEDDPTRAARRGEVYLVGSGPGDPDLLTFRALRLMQRADVVLHDSLVAPAILELVNADAERIHVGKRAARHTLAQPDINALMVRLARDGRRVLRLKGGDPFMFGRGGEEIARLADAGVAFQIVPGITAAGGCAAYAGIPLTHRDYAQSVIFVTGHLKNGALDLPWDRLARPGQTVVVFMASKSLAAICRALREHGLAADWPAALVVEGTTARQQVVAATLADLPARVDALAVRAPALLIVGEVVSLHQTLDWFTPVSR